MKISSSFKVARGRTRVWDMFQDVPRVAGCIPGTRITESLGDGRFKGRVEVRLGPIATAFEGDAQHLSNAAEWTGTISGSGRDRGAGSRARFTTVYRLAEQAGGTEVTVESDIGLAGAVAQFGRTGLLEEVTNRMLQQFAVNLESQLGEEAPMSAATAAPLPPPLVTELKLGGLLWASLLSWLRRTVGKLMGRTG